MQPILKSSSERSRDGTMVKDVVLPLDPSRNVEWPMWYDYARVSRRGGVGIYFFFFLLLLLYIRWIFVVRLHTVEQGIMKSWFTISPFLKPARIINHTSSCVYTPACTHLLAGLLSRILIV